MTDEPPPKPKSMSEFDYFAEDAGGGEVSRGGQSLDHLQRQRRRLWIHAAMILAVFAVCASYVAGLREIIFYHFRNEPILELGRVDEKDPTTLPHDRYVRLAGITEARAAQVKWIRGLSWQQYYRYYHLLGTPVFIEVPADEAKGNIEAFEEVKLEGRLVDLTRATEYERLMSFLSERLYMRIPDRAFMLQASVKPDGGKSAVILFAVIGLLLSVNIGLWIRRFLLLRRRTQLKTRRPKV